MKSLIYALAVVVPLSAAPAFAGARSTAPADTNSPADSVSRPDDEQNATLAAQLEDAQRGVGPVFGDDTRATPPAQEGQGQSGSSGQSGLTIAPYPNSERPPFDGGR